MDHAASPTLLSPHAEKIFGLLARSKKPMSAYEILEKMRGSKIRAPQTVYRALDSLLKHGRVHRIESLSSFIACHHGGADHGRQFAICRLCKSVEELHDHNICTSVKDLGKKLQFRVEQERLEVIGICRDCTKKKPN